MPHKKTTDNNKPISVEQARGKIAKAMRDLVAYSPRAFFRYCCEPCDRLRPCGLMVSR
jgi:hypothetical protein